MKIIFPATALLLLCCFRAVAADVPPSIVLVGCDKGSSCVSMLLDVPDNSAQAVIISPKDQDVEAAQGPNGYTSFHIRFEGRVNGKIGTIDAIFTGYTDGIHCTAFGQGTVGFLGYSDSGNPIIKSSVGPIEVTDSRIHIGCEHCLLVNDTKTGNALASFKSPGYDLALTGHRDEDFSFDLPGGYNVKTGPTCLRVQDKGPVQSVNPERCSVPRNEIKIEIKGDDCS